MNILSQIFGIGAMISLFLIYQQKERSKMLKCKLTADICWTIHYILLGAYGGAIPNFVGIFRETVFLNREKQEWADSRIWLIVFLLINWGIGIFTFSSPINIMPIAASTIVSVAMWIKNPTAAKLISIPVSTTFLLYDYFVGSWIGIINESMALASIAIYFVKNKERRKNGNNI